MTTDLSIVIPALDTAGPLGRTLAAVGAEGMSGLREVIVVDGGSADATASVARAAGARVVEAARGRGRQLAAGAREASGEWLLFLHADTVLDPGWAAAVAGYASEPRNAGRAAAFRFALDDTARAARRLEAIVAWRTRRLGLPYGDQGLLISRALYESLGGFKPLPLMEDVDLVRRIGRRRLDMLQARAVTSAARYREAGYLERSGRNLACLALYLMGMPISVVERLYG